MLNFYYKQILIKQKSKAAKIFYIIEYDHEVYSKSPGIEPRSEDY